MWTYILKRLSKNLFLIKFLISVLFVYILFSKFLQVSSFEALSVLKPETILVCLGLTLLSLIFKTQRWDAMIKMLGGKADFKNLVKLYAIGFYYGSISPGRAGEFVKGSRLLKNGLQTKQGMVSILYERFYDIATPVAFICIYYFFNAFLHEDAPSVLLLLSSYSISIVLWISMVWVFQVFKNKIQFLKAVDDIPIETLLKHTFVPAAASILNWLCLALTAYLLLSAFGVNIAFSRVIFAVCIAILSLLFPLSINGWGIREAAYVWALSPFSEPSVSIIFSITFTLIGTYSLALIGLIFELTTKSSGSPKC